MTKRPKLVEKPWGKFEEYSTNEKNTVKIISVKKGEILSLQSHKYRKELWVALDDGLIAQVSGRKKKLKELIQQNSNLFWWVPEEKKDNISLDALVEAILNYGSEESVKKLFEYFGEKKVAQIFKKNTAKRTRVNYFPEVVNYFNLYFSKHVQGYSE